MPGPAPLHPALPPQVRGQAPEALRASLMLATPGRLVDLLKSGLVDFARLRTLVLDEADRMLDMGFRDDMVSILSKAKPDRQTVLFSATLPPPIRDWSRRSTWDWSPDADWWRDEHPRPVQPHRPRPGGGGPAPPPRRRTTPSSTAP